MRATTHSEPSSCPDRRSSGSTLSSLAELDAFCGDDPEIEQVLKLLPKPADWEDYRCRVPIRPRPSLSFMGDYSVVELRIEEFERVRMFCNGTLFSAWKSLKDGKIYF